jgi:hypothetical protein
MIVFIYDSFFLVKNTIETILFDILLLQLDDCPPCFRRSLENGYTAS